MQVSALARLRLRLRTPRSAVFRIHLRGLPIGSLLIVALFVVIAVLADRIAPHDPLEPSLADRLQPPVFSGGTWQYVLGTDHLGRDILSRIMAGARLTLLVAVTALLAGTVVGSAIGLVSAYVGGKVDSVLMRTADLTLSYPGLLLAFLLVALIGPSISNVVIVIAFVLWSRFARVVRGEALSIREQNYVALAQVAGASPFRVITRHILPNVLNTIIVYASLSLGSVILSEASLSFLGVGVPPPEADWGSMVSDGRGIVTTAWWVSTMPGLAIMLVVLALNLFADWLRERLDPKLRGL